MFMLINRIQYEPVKNNENLESSEEKKYSNNNCWGWHWSLKIHSLKMLMISGKQKTPTESVRIRLVRQTSYLFVRKFRYVYTA